MLVEVHADYPPAQPDYAFIRYACSYFGMVDQVDFVVFTACAPASAFDERTLQRWRNEMRVSA